MDTNHFLKMDPLFGKNTQMKGDLLHSEIDSLDLSAKVATRYTLRVCNALRTHVGSSTVILAVSMFEASESLTFLPANAPR